MVFVHADGSFPDLLRIVAAESGLAPSLVEKDYWVTHALWSLQDQGFDLWFKGGTSLSKGFGLIERFSEDIDLKLEPGTAEAISSIENWHSTKIGHSKKRQEHFETLAKMLTIPNSSVYLNESHDKYWRSASLRVEYSCLHQATLGPLKPFVLLEIGDARVTPFEAKDLSSHVHDYLDSRGQLSDFEDNRPKSLPCLHPSVTLAEKIEAIQKRFLKEDAAKFVRHYEDAAKIILHEGSLPTINGYLSTKDLLKHLTAQGLQPLDGDCTAFNPDDGDIWQTVEKAYEDIAPMFWGERVTLTDACDAIRTWIRRTSTY